MTPAGFRKIVLKMPGVLESSHMGHPDFRVGKRIMATLFRKDGLEWGMVKLKSDQQKRLIGEHPMVFQPIAGGWGRQGCTQVSLKNARVTVLREALLMAWRNAAPTSLTR
jgi:hypothetical protein